MKNILIVAAHPDDEVLGCGGTISQLIKNNYKAHILILGEGVTSRDNWKKEDLIKLKNQVYKSNNIIGINKNNIYLHDFPDNKFDSVPLLNIVKVINELKNKIQPEIIFTHFQNDLNIDHRITYQAVITSTRPMQDEIVKTIYSFEVLSSTEWNYPLKFSPNVFFDITDTLNIKISAMNAYKSEIRMYPHPRSIIGITKNAQCWGMKVGLEYAEAFELIRDIYVKR